MSLKHLQVGVHTHLIFNSVSVCVELYHLLGLNLAVGGSDMQQLNISSLMSTTNESHNKVITKHNLVELLLHSYSKEEQIVTLRKKSFRQEQCFPVVFSFTFETKSK